MSWFDSAVPGAQLVLMVLGLPILIFGLIKLLVLPLALWFEARAWKGRRTQAPTLLGERPFVSIIVPGYNESAVIANCVEAIALTRYDRYEVLLIDDGSTDDTAALMAGLARRDPRFHFYSQTNAGKGAALNLGIRHASGDVLMFVDADGIFSDRTVEQMLEGFRDERTGAVCGDDRPVNLNRVQTRMLAFISHVGTGMVRRALTLIGCLPIVSGNIGAFRASVMAEIGVFREDTVGEDLELTWRVQKARYKVAFAPRALVYAESPSTIGGLWRQRTRWARGLLQTMRIHKGMIGNPRYGRFGFYLLFNTLTMVILPVLQVAVLLDLAFLLAMGRTPFGQDALAVLGWFGLGVTLVLSVFAIAMNRAWRDLCHVWALPLIPFYSVFAGFTMIAALLQEAKGSEAKWNKGTRSGVVSVTAARADALP
ncbi:glycosyltransferase (plasmid) [Pseudarthrobacter sp. P1]|uniref:glycosyltransferase n=1 Tax=Pseudarthrobacter sp. P1 TaxID=3418418 RepID=UPI003CF8FAE5